MANSHDSNEPAAWATEIIDALQAQYNTEMIKENDSGDALIRLDDAIAAVEDAEKHYTAPLQRPPLTVQDLQQALVDTGLIFPEAIDDAEGFDHGVTLERIDKLHLLLVGVGS